MEFASLPRHVSNEERTHGALSRSRTRTTAILDDMPHAAARPALGPSAVVRVRERESAPRVRSSM